MTAIARLRAWARLIMRDTLAVYFAARDPRTPGLVRILAIAIAAYAFSPIDLIPDFIPVLGYLDDLLIVPTGLFLVIKLLPPTVLKDTRAQASAVTRHPTSFNAGVVVVCVWFLSVAAIGFWWFLA